jgi:hypothetical protein
MHHCSVLLTDKTKADKLVNNSVIKKKRNKWKNICRNFKMLKNIEEDNRAQYFKYFVPEFYDHPALIIRPGEEDDTFYILDQGDALIFIKNTTDVLKEHKYLIMGGLKEGGCFNESQYLNKTKIDYGVIIVSKES